MPHSPLTIPTSPSRQHLGYSRYDSKMDREPGSWASKLERRIDREANREAQESMRADAETFQNREDYPDA